MKATLDPVGRFAMRYRWILAAIMVVMIFCTGCDDSDPMPGGAPRLYVCTEQQHEKAIKETKEALALIKETDASWYYGAAVMRKCVRKPKP